MPFHFKVQALYDFDGQEGTGELSIRTGETLTITRTDVGEGWWEGTNSRGESGLFPEAYVEKIDESVVDDAPPAMAPPPLPPDYGSGGGPEPMAGGGWAPTVASAATAASSSSAAASSSAPAAPKVVNNIKNDDEDDDWGNAGWGLPPTTTATATTTASNSSNQLQQQQQQHQQQEEWCGSDYQADNRFSTANTNQGYDQDEWDSDFDEHSDPPASQMPPPSTTPGGGQLGIPKSNATTGSSGDLSSMGKKGSVTGGAGRTSFNRFSVFVKSGSESFVLGKCNVKVQEQDIVTVIDVGDQRFSWLNSKPPYSCAIASPKKESKMHGLKSYIAYQLTPSFNNIQVSRRYKHFDWLHERLVEKYSLIPIPPLPDKQIQGRYEDEFIEHRMNQLQSFVDRVCRHPILSQSEVWQHFLTCTDEKRWKSGKRKAEKDTLVGGSFLMAIKRPEKPLDPDFLDRQVEIFSRFTTSFDSAVKNMLKTCADQTQKCQSQYKREFLNIGKSFTQLATAMDQDTGTYSINLNNAVRCTGEMYEDIAKMYDDQPRNDWEHFGDMMHDYRGLLGGWPSVLQIHNGAVGKAKEYERLAIEGKATQAEVTEVASRTETLSYALLAEINTFHLQRTKDIKQVHQKFLQEQITFYQKITEKLQESLRMFDNC